MKLIITYIIISSILNSLFVANILVKYRNNMTVSKLIFLVFKSGSYPPQMELSYILLVGDVKRVG